MTQRSFESYNTAPEQVQDFPHRDSNSNLNEYRMEPPLKGMIAYGDFSSRGQVDLKHDIYNSSTSDYPYPRQTQPARHAYGTSEMYAHRLYTESGLPPAHATAPERHFWTGSFKAGDTTCDVTLPQVAITNMPENCRTMPRIQEIPDVDGCSHGYHSVMFNFSKHDGRIDFNVLGLSKEHAYTVPQNWDRASWPVRLQESTRANHAALSESRYVYGTATGSDVAELSKCQIVPIERTFLRR
jgi:hypothetical protein